MSKSPPNKESGKHGVASPNNPVGGRYGLENGLRARLLVYISALTGECGLRELQHRTDTNGMGAE